MNVLAQASEWKEAPARRRTRKPAAAPAQHYFAFLSYSHRDEDIAKWLHDALERFRVPTNLVGRLTEHGAVPRRLTPVFRDVGELSASDDLGAEIQEALAGSRFLVVLCSPAAAESRWTNAEIAAFKRARPEGCVLAAIVGGEPFASDVQGREAEECFPPALRFKFDRRGKPTAKRAEPLAADLRGGGEARRIGFLKLVAGMLGVGLDELVQRDAVRRQRRLAGISAASLLGMVVAIGLAITAIQARDAARDQRREAESLIGFMLGDLRSTLEPLGRLDALDGVGAKVLTYYEHQDTSDLSDAALMQRSRALTLMGEVASLRGDLDTALRLYREAMNGTAEALARQPGEPQRLFDHAQNVFWIGELARQRGKLDVAAAAMREYGQLAQRMIAAEPDNMRWRMEAQYADANLGIVLMEQRRFAEARDRFAGALQTITGLATADPDNGDYRKGLVETLAWLADAEVAAGHLDEAIGHRRRHIQLLEQLASGADSDVAFRQKLIPSYRALASLQAARGELDAAIGSSRSAVGVADRLLPLERDNSKWSEFGTGARLDLAGYLLAAGQKQDAAAQTGIACAAADRLIARDASVVHWRMARRDCLRLRAQLALDRGDYGAAAAAAAQALQAATRVNSSDRVGDLYAAADIRRIAGDVRQSMSDPAAARAQWQAGLAMLPTGAREQPSETAGRALLLERLGRSAELQPLANRLRNIGYRRVT